MIRQQGRKAFHVVAPITMQFTGNPKPGHDLAARLCHARPGGITRRLIERAGCIGNDKHFIALLPCGQGRECNTHFRDDPGDQQLFFSGCLDRLDEIFVIPGVDITGTSDIRGVGEKLLQFRDKRPVRAILKTGGEYGGELEIFCRIGQRENVILEIIGREILDQIGRPDW